MISQLQEDEAVADGLVAADHGRPHPSDPGGAGLLHHTQPALPAHRLLQPQAPRMPHSRPRHTRLLRGWCDFGFPLKVKHCIKLIFTALLSIR